MHGASGWPPCPSPSRRSGPVSPTGWCWVGSCRRGPPRPRVVEGPHPNPIDEELLGKRCGVDLARIGAEEHVERDHLGMVVKGPGLLVALGRANVGGRLLIIDEEADLTLAHSTA
jgi:hypothetical protein